MEDDTNLVIQENMILSEKVNFLFNCRSKNLNKKL